MTIARVRGAVCGGVFALLLLPAAQGAAQELPASARLRAGAAVPLAPTMVLGGGEVLLDVTIGTDGGVSHIETLRSTPPYTELMAGYVQGWRFDPAKGSVRGVLQTVNGHVLVAAVFRPPDIYNGPSRGEPSPCGVSLRPNCRGCVRSTCRPPIRRGRCATARCSSRSN